MKNLGQLIRELRQAKRLLIRHVAVDLDIDPSLLSRIERGDKRPTRAQVIQLSEILGAEKNELLAKYLSEKVVSMLVTEPVALQVISLAKSELTSSTGRNNCLPNRDLGADASSRTGPS